MKNSFDVKDKDEFLSRIHKLNENTQPNWGKMNSGQMIAHLNVAYEMAIDDMHPKATGLKKWLMKKFVKKVVVGEKPYPRNSRTAPSFLIKSNKDFTKEKSRLIEYINKTCELGENHFDGKESNSFGKLTKAEWNNLFSKHLEHHLTQFGV